MSLNRFGLWGTCRKQGYMISTTAITTAIVSTTATTAATATTTTVVNKAVGNNRCFTMVMTNWFWAQQQKRNYHMLVARLFR